MPYLINLTQPNPRNVPKCVETIQYHKCPLCLSCEVIFGRDEALEDHIINDHRSYNRNINGVDEESDHCELHTDTLDIKLRESESGQPAKSLDCTRIDSVESSATASAVTDTDVTVEPGKRPHKRARGSSSDPGISGSRTETRKEEPVEKARKIEDNNSSECIFIDDTPQYVPNTDTKSSGQALRIEPTSTNSEPLSFGFEPIHDFPAICPSGISPNFESEFDFVNSASSSAVDVNGFRDNNSPTDVSADLPRSAITDARSCSEHIRSSTSIKNETSNADFSRTVTKSEDVKFTPNGLASAMDDKSGIVNANFSAPKNTTGKYKCNLCGERYNQKVFLNRHRLRHEQRNEGCNYCNIFFVDKTSLVKHLLAEHGCYRCLGCGFDFSNPNDFGRHHGSRVCRGLDIGSTQ